MTIFLLMSMLISSKLQESIFWSSFFMNLSLHILFRIVNLNCILDSIIQILDVCVMTLWKLRKTINDKANSNKYRNRNRQKNCKRKMRRVNRYRSRRNFYYYDHNHKCKRNRLHVPKGVKIKATFQKSHFRRYNQSFDCNNAVRPNANHNQDIQHAFEHVRINPKQKQKRKFRQNRWFVKSPKLKVEKCRFTACQTTYNDNHPAFFDSGSFVIGIDNHSSCTISNCIRDFIGPIVPTKIKIRGFQGATAFANGVGTVKMFTAFLGQRPRLATSVGILVLLSEFSEP